MMTTMILTIMLMTGWRPPGRTALHLAAYPGNLSCLALLLSMEGVQVSQTNWKPTIIIQPFNTNHHPTIQFQSNSCRAPLLSTKESRSTYRSSNLTIWTKSSSTTFNLIHYSAQVSTKEPPHVRKCRRWTWWPSRRGRGCCTAPVVEEPWKRWNTFGNEWGNTTKLSFLSGSFYFRRDFFLQGVLYVSKCVTMSHYCSFWNLLKQKGNAGNSRQHLSYVWWSPRLCLNIWHHFLKTCLSKEFKVLTRFKQVELLLEEKSLDCHLQDSEGRTGLMVAAMEGRLGVVKLILR